MSKENKKIREETSRYMVKLHEMNAISDNYLASIHEAQDIAALKVIAEQILKETLIPEVKDVLKEEVRSRAQELQKEEGLKEEEELREKAEAEAEAAEESEAEKEEPKQPLSIPQSLASSQLLDRPETGNPVTFRKQWIEELHLAIKQMKKERKRLQKERETRVKYLQNVLTDERETAEISKQALTTDKVDAAIGDLTAMIGRCELKKRSLEQEIPILKGYPA